MQNDFEHLPLEGTDEGQPVPSKLHVCPHLGIIDDPDTAVSFPAPANYCFRFEEPIFLQLSDQAELCLTPRYTDCHIYQQQSNAAVATANDMPRAKGQRPLLRIVAGLTMLVLILLSVLFLWPQVGLGARQTSEPETEAPLETNAVSGQQTAAEVAVPAPISPTSDAVAITTAAPEPNAAPESAFPRPEQARVSAAGNALADQVASVDVMLERPALTLEGLPDLFGSLQIAEIGNISDGFGGPISYGEAETAVTIEDRSTDQGVTIFLRQEPRSDNDSFVALPQSDAIQPVGRDESGTWVKLRAANGVEGWLDVTDPEASAWITGLPLLDENGLGASAQSVSTTLDVVRPAIAETSQPLRAAPGEGFTTLTILAEGETVALLGKWQDGPWVRVRLQNGFEGWLDAAQLAALE